MWTIRQAGRAECPRARGHRLSGVHTSIVRSPRLLNARIPTCKGDGKGVSRWPWVGIKLNIYLKVLKKNLKKIVVTASFC